MHFTFLTLCALALGKDFSSDFGSQLIGGASFDGFCFMCCMPALITTLYIVL